MNAREELLFLVREARRNLTVVGKPCYATQELVSFFATRPRVLSQLNVQKPRVVDVQPPPPAPKKTVPQRIAPSPAMHKPLPKNEAKRADPHLLRSLLQRAVPHVALQEAIPSDAIAKRVATSWRTYGEEPHVFLLCDEDRGALDFCRNLLRALHNKGMRMRTLQGKNLERENRWESFVQQRIDVCIATQGIWTYAGAKPWLRVLPATQEMFLHNIPLIALDAISSYSPEKKKALWNRLCSLLPLPQSSSIKP